MSLGFVEYAQRQAAAAAKAGDDALELGWLKIATRKPCSAGCGPSESMRWVHDGDKARALVRYCRSCRPLERTRGEALFAAMHAADGGGMHEAAWLALSEGQQLRWEKAAQTFAAEVLGEVVAAGL